MRSKIATTTVFACLLSLVGPVWAQEGDPNLVGWWTFDDAGTGTVLDSSGNGHHGTFRGDAHFEPGLLGEAVAFDGNGDYVNIDGYKGIVGDGTGIHAFSIAAWIKATGNGEIVGWGSTINPSRAEFRVDDNRLRYESGGGNVQGDTAVTDDEWHHVAVTVPTNALYVDVKLYLDGQDDTQPENDIDPTRPMADYDLKMGLRYNEASSRQYTGLIDDVRLYDKVLTLAEIQTLALRPKAYNPTPADGTIGVTDPLLSWQPRATAVLRDIYLSTDPNLGPDDLVAPRHAGIVYWHGPGLEPGTAYYWRVDEIDADGTVHEGDVWMFFFSPLEAWQPVPLDGSPYADPGLTLSWVRGLNGISHDVYFGTDRDEVAEGLGDTFKGNQFEMTYATGDLEMDATYYWRVDEIDQVGVKVMGTVWSFKTLPEIPITDPNLRCWWTLDAGAGDRAVDWSGHGAHGQFNDAALWVDGYDGLALEFDGIDDSVVYSFDEAQDWSGLTVSLWAKATMLAQDTWSSVFSNHVPNSAGFQLDVDGTDPGNYRINPSGLVFGSVRTDWVHLAVASTGTAAKLYYNGVWMISGTLTDTTFNQFAISLNRNAENWFAGLIDDVRVYDRELTQEEIKLVMRIDPLRAWNPHPADGAVADVRTASPLTWTQGDNASQHDVYFGTDEGAVAAADAGDTSGIYRGRLGATSYAPAEGIEWGRGYYWRVDEINADGSITAGRVWGFTVADYLIVDDFESYTNESPNRVFQAWIDGLGFSPDEYFPDGGSGNGTGAAVGHDVWSPESQHYNGTIMETDSVYSGRQAMPLYYDNSATPYRSEATRTWAMPQDWTFNDVNTLVLYVQGTPVDFLQTAPDAITMSAAGTEIWDVADEFRYAYKQLNGDGTIIARVDSVVDTHAWAKGGVMIRENLEADSRYAMALVSARNGVAFQRRLATGSTSTRTTEAVIVAPHWVKLTRTGNELTAQHSADGQTWVDVGPDPAASTDTVVMGGTLYVGLALTSHSSGNPTTAQFSQIQTTGSVSGAWEVAEIGVDHPGNSPANVYVTLEDTAGRSATVTHPDGTAAVLNEEWRPWAISISEFGADGVNLQAIRTMSVGVGDPTNPQPDGAGLMLFDDFRIMQGVPAEPNAVE